MLYQKEIVRRFNKFINQQDFEGLSALMTGNHLFIDSSDSAFRGKTRVIEAWKEFFRLHPDYRNVFERIQSKGNLVIVTGYSTCSNRRLEGPALWTARIKGGRISYWHVYNDTPENRKKLGIMEKSQLRLKIPTLSNR